MDKWQELRTHFDKQATELAEDDDYAIFALEVLDLMDSIEEQERIESKHHEQTSV
jgi:hypothetical protein